MNTAFSGPQLADVARARGPGRDRLRRGVHGRARGGRRGRRRFIAWHEPGSARGDTPRSTSWSSAATVRPRAAARAGQGRDPHAPARPARRREHAARQPQSLDPVAALLEQIPLRARERTMIAAPLFHSWGFTHFTLALGLATTIVLQRRFDPEATLARIAQHRCTTLVVVPVMIQRILELDDEVLRRHDVSSLRAVPVSGSALPGPLSERWMDLFGDNLYNLYGSTEDGVGDDRDAGRPARRAGHRRQAAARDGRAAVRRRRQGGRAGRERAHLRRQRPRLRGLHGRRRQGRDRGAAVVGRRRALRRRRAPVRRRPRRRHDRLGRRERLPGRGRGAARRPRGDRRGGRLRRRRRAVRPAPQGGRRDARRASSSSADEVKRFVKSNLAAYKVPRDVEFVDELPRTSTGKVLKRELRGDARRAEAVVCWRHASAYGRLRSRAPGAHLGRGPPARPARARRAVLVRRAALRGHARRGPGAARHLAHDGQRLGAAAALRGRRDGAVRPLPGARGTALRGRRARGRAARRRRRGALLALRQRRRRAATSPAGRATRWRSRCRRRSRAGRTAPGCARTAARTSTTSRSTRTSPSPTGAGRSCRRSASSSRPPARVRASTLRSSGDVRRREHAGGARRGGGAGRAAGPRQPQRLAARADEPVTDVSSEMVATILPLYLVFALGADAAAVRRASTGSTRAGRRWCGSAAA